jgi:hypothetical protein
VGGVFKHSTERLQRQRELERQGNCYPSPCMAAIQTLAVYISYDLPASRRNSLSQPQVWPVSRGPMGELGLWDDSSVHRFASPVVAGASIAGVRGKS